MNKIPAAAETVESSESEEECDSDEGDEVGQVISNVTHMESVLATHRIACNGQKFTRLPCAAHKVLSKPVVSLILFLATSRFILFLIRVLTLRFLPLDRQYRRPDASLSNTESHL